MKFFIGIEFLRKVYNFAITKVVILVINCAFSSV